MFASSDSVIRTTACRRTPNTTGRLTKVLFLRARVECLSGENISQGVANVWERRDVTNPNQKRVDFQNFSCAFAH